MKRPNNLPLIKAIPLLSVLTIGVVFLVCVLCINESRSFLPAFAAYIDSGCSLFIPDLPRIDLLWFLPLEQQPVPLTWGNIIDIIIFTNIGLILNRIPYDCYRRASDCRLMVQIVDLHLDAPNMKNKAGSMIDGKYDMPCIDTRSFVTRDTTYTNQAVHHEELGLEVSIANIRRLSQRGFRHIRVTLLTRLALLASHLFSSSLNKEDYPRSGSCFCSKLSLYAYFQEIGVYPL